VKTLKSTFSQNSLFSLQSILTTAFHWRMDKAEEKHEYDKKMMKWISDVS
jgi:hypothetical protein